MGSNGTPFSPVAEGNLRIADVVRWRVQRHGSGLDHRTRLGRVSRSVVHEILFYPREKPVLPAAGDNPDCG